VAADARRCALGLPRQNLAFSPVGNGAATRAGTVVVFAAIAFIAFRLLQKGDRGRASPADSANGASPPAPRR